MGKPLPIRQQRFVEEYLIDHNATQAAIRAGYSAKTAEQQGPRLLGNVGVARAITAAIAELSQRVEVTQEMVVSGLFREATLKGEGSSHSARISAWSLLGKHLGMMVDRKVIGLKRFEDMTDEEIRYVLGGIADEIGVAEAGPPAGSNGFSRA